MTTIASDIVLVPWAQCVHFWWNRYFWRVCWWNVLICTWWNIYVSSWSRPTTRCLQRSWQVSYLLDFNWCFKRILIYLKIVSCRLHDTLNLIVVAHITRCSSSLLFQCSWRRYHSFCFDGLWRWMLYCVELVGGTPMVLMVHASRGYILYRLVVLDQDPFLVYFPWVD